ncbi:hypothetical protein, partial [Lentzea nigeriaca]
YSARCSAGLAATPAAWAARSSRTRWSPLWPSSWQAFLVSRLVDLASAAQETVRRLSEALRAG